LSVPRSIRSGSATCDLEHRVEHVHGALEDHGDLAPADFSPELLVTHRPKVAAVKEDLAIEAGGVFGGHPHEGVGEAALAAA
jgi:hypothetical protein